MAYKIIPEQLYAGLDDEYMLGAGAGGIGARNPELVLPPKWQFLKVETVLERDPAWSMEKAPQFRLPREIRDFIVELLRDLERSDRERLYAIFLDQPHRVIGVHEVHVGSLTESVAHPRELFKAAIVAGAAAIVFVHNHPSGNLQFSRMDKKLLERLHEISVLLGIRLLDFMAIGHDGGYVSAEEAGIMPREPEALGTVYGIGA